MYHHMYVWKTNSELSQKFEDPQNKILQHYLYSVRSFQNGKKSKRKESFYFSMIRVSIISSLNWDVIEWKEQHVYSVLSISFSHVVY